MPDVEIPRYKLALKIGWQYFRRFALEHKQDFQQVAALLAWETAHAQERDAVRAFERGFKHAMHDYGYRYAQVEGTWRWTRGENVVRIQANHGRQLVRCENPNCNRYFSRQNHKKSARNFCSPPCYRASRRTRSSKRAQEAKITLEAIRRFQQRVAPVTEAQVIAAIRAGIAAPVKTVSQGLARGIEIHCSGEYEFRCRCRERAGRLEICTVLESAAKNQQMRARRTQKRALPLTSPY